MASHTTNSGDPQPSESGAAFPREQFLGLVRAGLWPAAALAYLEIGKAEWEAARQRDAELSAETRKASAAFELIHVRNLHAKIQEANDWRGSAWWLAQRFPRRYGTERRRGTSGADLAKALGALEEALRDEFADGDDWARLARVFARVDAMESEK